MKRKIKRIFIEIYCVLFTIVYKTASEEIKRKIDLDIARYDNKCLAETLFYNKNFRNVFYYRLSGRKIIRICKILLKSNPNIEIHVKNGKIGANSTVYVDVPEGSTVVGNSKLVRRHTLRNF